MINIDDRIRRLESLLTLVSPIPQAWQSDEQFVAEKQHRMLPQSCDRWSRVRDAWVRALRWREGLEDILATMLAVTISTVQEGDQLFMLVIGPPGSAKTRMCDAILISPNCHPLEHLTGFHSGYQGVEGETADYSLLSRINGKTLVTPEGDVLMSNPKFQEIMSQQRRIFDGVSGASYKNRKKDLRWTGLRTPWIMAGTYALIQQDQSKLGDRFLRIFVDDVDPDEERAILMRVAHSARRSVRRTVNCSPDTQMSPEMSAAYRLTGGYVDHLRLTAERSLNQIAVHSDPFVEEYCADLAQFTAFLRSQPSVSRGKMTSSPLIDLAPKKELPSRLVGQYCRLADCLAAVLQKPVVDEQVLRIVRKVAIDTSDPRVVQLASAVRSRGDDGAYSMTLAHGAGCADERVQSVLTHLRSIGCIRRNEPRGDGVPGADAYPKWYLTNDMARLWDSIFGV